VRQENVALGVNRDGRVIFKCSPQAYLDIVPHCDGVIRVELGGSLTGECPGKQVGAEDIAFKVGGVINILHGLRSCFRNHGRLGCRCGFNRRNGLFLIRPEIKRLVYAVRVAIGSERGRRDGCKQESKCESQQGTPSPPQPSP